MAIRRYLAMTGEEIAAFDKMPENAAWMFCPFSEGLADVPWQLPRGCLLVLTDAVTPENADVMDVVHKLCSLEPVGVLLDFQRSADRGDVLFAEKLRQALPCPVIPSHHYADRFAGPVFLPPLPLNLRISDYIKAWQGREIWMDISREGQRITLTEAGAAFESLPLTFPTGTIHEDKKLHCHYTISLQENAAVFTLWRTEEDLEALLQEVESLGIQNAIGLYQEWQGSSRMPFRGEC